MIGQTISHYKITAKLGEGGMGVVYKAEDIKLERTVALKFLAAHLVSDDEIRKRFEREAKAAAALNHPNICHVYEIDEADGKTFIAMAYIEGQGLDEKIAAGPLKLNEALDIAHQIALGLQAAHAKGIVHRDIKPANVMISGTGSHHQVTIMDFGLAQLTERSKLTRLDETMGTIAYMSPEQTLGAEVDHRTDIWALGVVLYEMVSGQRPFKGHYDKAVMYSITAEEPEPLTGMRTGVPMELEWIVGKCLAKEADSRYQNATELAVDLRNLQEKLKSGRSTVIHTGAQTGLSPMPGVAQPPQPDTATVAPVPAGGVFLPKRKVRLFQALFALSVLAALFPAFFHYREPPRDIPISELTLELPSGAWLHSFSLSPDGRHVALALGQGQGDSRLVVRSLDSIKLRELTGTDGAQYPFWSPDSRYIAFFAEDKLKKIALSGGPAQTLCEAQSGRGGTWNAAGVIVFSPSPYGQIQRVSEGGGVPVMLTKEDESDRLTSRRFPWFLPDGRHYLFAQSATGQERTGVYVASIDGGDPQRLLAVDSNAVFARPAGGDGGFLFFVRDGALLAQQFDPGRLKLTGEPSPVSDSVASLSRVRSYGFSISDAGGALYVRGRSLLTPPTQLAWFDRTGKLLEPLGKPGVFLSLSLSPDESRVALTYLRYREDEATEKAVWLLDLIRGTMSRVTTENYDEVDPYWSPDGRRIAYSSNRTGRLALYQKDADGAEKPEPLLSLEIGNAGAYLDDWSPDGRFLLYSVMQPRTLSDLYVLPLEGDRKPFAYLESEFAEYAGRFSPDGRWVAYVSMESGMRDVYLRRFPSADRKRRISTQGGSAPLWSKSGRELYYIDPAGNLMAVALKTEPEMEPDTPKLLFQTHVPIIATGAVRGVYDVSRDGRFLIASRIEASEPENRQTLIMLSNWRAKVGK